jgi:hypothetical protein
MGVRMVEQAPSGDRKPDPFVRSGDEDFAHFVVLLWLLLWVRRVHQ